VLLIGIETTANDCAGNDAAGHGIRRKGQDRRGVSLLALSLMDLRNGRLRTMNVPFAREWTTASV